MKIPIEVFDGENPLEDKSNPFLYRGDKPSIILGKIEIINIPLEYHPFLKELQKLCYQSFFIKIAALRANRILQGYFRGIATGQKPNPVPFEKNVIDALIKHHKDIKNGLIEKTIDTSDQDFEKQFPNIYEEIQRRTQSHDSLLKDSAVPIMQQINNATGDRTGGMRHRLFAHFNEINLLAQDAEKYGEYVTRNKYPNTESMPNNIAVINERRKFRIELESAKNKTLTEAAHGIAMAHYIAVNITATPYDGAIVNLGYELGISDLQRKMMQLEKQS